MRDRSRPFHSVEAAAIAAVRRTLNSESDEQAALARAAKVLSAALSAAAAAVRAAPIETFLEKDEKWWERRNGAALEPALRVDEALGGSPVRLVDARFLIELAERGGRLCRRQDLPEEAFVSPEALRRLPAGGDFGECLRIMSISQ